MEAANSDSVNTIEDQNLKEDAPSTANSLHTDHKEEDNAAQLVARLDWQSLEQRFEDEMRQAKQQEIEIKQECQKLMNFFNLWAETPSKHEVERASKRLKTRMAYVQNRECQLEGEHQHHEKVVKAFQSALDLLSES